MCFIFMYKGILDESTTSGTGAAAMSECSKLLLLTWSHDVTQSPNYENSPLMFWLDIIVVDKYILNPITACRVGQYVNEGRCISCPGGQYQDDDYHVETACKNCTGTEFTISDLKGSMIVSVFE